jgi:hypothetical protein
MAWPSFVFRKAWRLILFFYIPISILFKQILKITVTIAEHMNKKACNLYNLTSQLHSPFLTG